MKAVILAAGRGLRFAKKSRRSVPKPLLKLNDRYLIEYVLLNLKKTGVSDFIIVVGFQAVKLIEALGDGDRYSLNIEYVYNPDYDKPLGLSALCAKKYLENEKHFILAMSDHIIETEGVKRLINYPLEDGACALLVEKKINTIFWLDDAAKVKLDGKYIRGIDKGFSDYDAVDCGVFKFSPIIFSELERHIDHPDSISAAFSSLADQSKMLAVDIGKYRWIDIDEYEELKFAKQHFSEQSDGTIKFHINKVVKTSAEFR